MPLLAPATLSASPQNEVAQKNDCGSTSSWCVRHELDEWQDVHAHERANPLDLHPLDDGLRKKKPAGLVSWKDLRNTRYIGEGAFCSVHGAQFEGKLVAVKHLKAEHDGDEEAIAEIELEAELLMEMSHEHVLKMIGHGRHLHRPFIVVERLQCSLSDKLKRTQSGVFFSQTERTQLSLPVSLDYAKQLAKAMVYIHHDAFSGRHVRLQPHTCRLAGCAVCVSPDLFSMFAPPWQLLHRDLKPDNIGITYGGRLVLIDFGLSKLIPSSPTEDIDDLCPVDMTGKTGSARYMAPEVALCRPYNTKAEVHSFSMILYEMVAHQKPFCGMDLDTLFSEVFIAGARTPLSRKWPSELRLLLTDCWHQDPKCRPNFRTVLRRVEDLLSADRQSRVVNAPLYL